MELIPPMQPWSSRRHHRSTSTDWKTDRARQLRRNPTPCEALLWERLRQSKAGYKFRRQHLLYGWIVDFWCPELGLAIEVDGPIHDQRRDQDEHRNRELSGYGISTLRFSNSEIVRDIDSCLAAIITTADRLKHTGGAA